MAKPTQQQKLHEKHKLNTRGSRPRPTVDAAVPQTIRPKPGKKK